MVVASAAAVAAQRPEDLPECAAVRASACRAAHTHARRGVTNSGEPSSPRLQRPCTLPHTHETRKKKKREENRCQHLGNKGKTRVILNRKKKALRVEGTERVKNDGKKKVSDGVPAALRCHIQVCTTAVHGRRASCGSRTLVVLLKVSSARVQHWHSTTQRTAPPCK